MGAVYIENRDSVGHYAYTCHIALPQAVLRSLYDGSGRDIDQIIESL